MSKFHWVFLNRRTKVQSSKMSQRRAEKLVAGLNASDLSPWWAWNPTLTEWIPLRNIVAVDGERVRLVLRPANNQKRSDDTETVTVQSNTNTDIRIKQETIDQLLSKDNRTDPLYSSIRIDGYSENKTGPEFNGDELSLRKIPEPPKLNATKSRESDRRNSNRIDMRIQVLLVSHGKTFRTFSDNLSLTGALLERQVPEIFQKSAFEIVLMVKRGLQEDKIVFRAQIVGDRMDPRRILFIDPMLPSIKRLEQVLREYIATLKELKRTS